VTHKSVAGIVFRLTTRGFWYPKTHVWKERVRSFSEAVLVYLGPTGLRASGNLSCLSAVWVPVTHD